MRFIRVHPCPSVVNWLVTQPGWSHTEIHMAETVYLKIACPSCQEHIEFPVEMRGHVINCPHCSLSMALELPGTQPETPPHANIYQRLRALNNLNPKPAVINLPEAFTKRPESRR